MELALVLLAAVVLWLIFDRVNEQFCLSWRNGELRLVRGAVPPSLKGALAEALRHMKVGRTTLRAHREERGLRLTASGLDDFSEQRLRNIVQLYPVSQLRSATRPLENRVWRFFGFEALVWLFGRKDD